MATAPVLPPAPQPAQLRMLWPAGRRPPRVPRPPKGYRLRTWREGDAAGYVAVMRAAGFDAWTEENVANVLKSVLPEGLFFVMHEATGRIVATTVACHNPIDHHPFGGELGWVAVDPAHRGRRLSAVTNAAVVRRFLRAGFANIYLRTDDFRLPAVRLYLDLGFVPFLFQDDMEGRWRKVFSELKRDWDRSGAIRL
jgi:mycothiol synthase